MRVFGVGWPISALELKELEGTYEILEQNTGVSQIIEIGQHESKCFPNS